MSVDLALVGATGAVGRTALDILADRDFPIGRLRGYGLRALGRTEDLHHLGQG